MSWVAFSLGAAAVWACSNILDKLVLHRWPMSPYVPMFAFGVVNFIAAVLIFILIGADYLSSFHIFLSILIGLIVCFQLVLYLKALQLGEVSSVIPFYNATGLFTAILGAIFLGELFSPMIYVGVLLLVGGAILISTKDFKKFEFGKPFYYIIIASFLVAVTLVMFKYLLDFADFWTIMAYSRIGVALGVLALIPQHWGDFKKTIKKDGWTGMQILFFSSILGFTGYAFNYVALETGFVTLVEALISLLPLFVLVLAVLVSLFSPGLIDEDIDKNHVARKFLAISLMIIGALIIT